MFGGATALAVASAAQAPRANAMRGVVAALTAGVLWGTMYIPYRKAYLTGMNPLSFITLFTVGELGMMSVIAIVFSGGLAPLWRELSGAREVLFWLLAGGFVWVIGDLFQQYAVKYAGITRGIPLSNTNQLWGLLWGVLVFGELRGVAHASLSQVIARLAGHGARRAGDRAFVRERATSTRSGSAAAAAQGEQYGVDPAGRRARIGRRARCDDAPSHVDRLAGRRRGHGDHRRLSRRWRARRRSRCNGDLGRGARGGDGDDARHHGPRAVADHSFH